MNRVLYINTADAKETIIRLVSEEDTLELKQNSKQNRNQAVLILIDKILKDNKLNLKNIDEIEVFIGPGSFTGLRVGVSIANTLATMLQIPINGKVNSPVEPIYA